MPSCAVVNCPSNVSNGGIRFHRFPSDDKLVGLWLDFCESDGKLNLNDATICSNHFNKDDYTLVPMLKKGIVPSVNGPGKSSKNSQKKKHKDDGSVTLPKMTKSGRRIITPAAYKDNTDDDKEENERDKNGYVKDNNNDDDEDDEDEDEDGIELDDDEILKKIEEESQMPIITGEDFDYTENEVPMYKCKDEYINEAEVLCNCCQSQIKMERDTRKFIENRLEKEKKKQKEEKKRRKHLEKLLGASMQRQKATELRAQVAEEAVKIYCPSQFVTGSSSTTDEFVPKKKKVRPSEKGRWSWKKPSNFPLNSSYKKSKSTALKNKTTLRPMDFATVELVEPDSPSRMELDPEDTTIILVQEDSDTPIVSFDASSNNRKMKTMRSPLNMLDEDELSLTSFDRTYRTSNGYYTCNDCPFKSLYKSELMKHEKKHLTKRKFVCFLCPFSSQNENVLTEHIALHKTAANKKRTFKCSQCNYQTTEKSDIISHEKFHFEEKMRMNDIVTSVPSTSQDFQLFCQSNPSSQDVHLN